MTEGRALLLSHCVQFPRVRGREKAGLKLSSACMGLEVGSYLGDVIIATFPPGPQDTDRLEQSAAAKRGSGAA